MYCCNHRRTCTPCCSCCFCFCLFFFPRGGEGAGCRPLRRFIMLCSFSLQTYCHLYGQQRWWLFMQAAFSTQTHTSIRIMKRCTAADTPKLSRKKGKKQKQKQQEQHTHTHTSIHTQTDTYTLFT